MRQTTSRSTSCDRPHARRSPALLSGLALAALALLAASAGALEQRSFTETLSFDGDDRLRIANLAGTVTVEHGGGSQLEVDVTVYAEGKNSAETRRMLDEMEFVRHRNRSGNREWALSYPVDRYGTLHYPSSEDRSESEGFWEKLADNFNFSTTNTRYLGERIKISRTANGPILFADLVVRLPADGKVGVRNVVGPIQGGSLSGDLVLDTGSGSIRVDTFDGTLVADTGSGSVKLGRASGEITVDTGSGGIDVEELVGNGNLDTGSGSVKVHRVAADRLIVDTGSGGILVEDGSVRELIADTGSGSIKVLNVEVEIFEGDTGSGGVTLESSLADAERIDIDTGSGSVKIYGGPDAQFDVIADQGSGRFHCGYEDAELVKDGREVIGARRGDQRTRIRVDTGSGSVTLSPS